MADTQPNLQTLSNEYQQIQDDLQTTLLALQKLESQREENCSVSREFRTLAADCAVVYKLVGPVLLKQDPDEAKRTVEGRLQFIEKEIARVEGAMGGLREKGERVRGKLQQRQQQQGVAGEGGGVKARG